MTVIVRKIFEESFNIILFCVANQDYEKFTKISQSLSPAALRVYWACDILHFSTECLWAGTGGGWATLDDIINIYTLILQVKLGRSSNIYSENSEVLRPKFQIFKYFRVQYDGLVCH